MTAKKFKIDRLAVGIVLMLIGVSIFMKNGMNTPFYSPGFFLNFGEYATLISAAFFIPGVFVAYSAFQNCE